MKKRGGVARARKMAGAFFDGALPPLSRLMGSADSSTGLAPKMKNLSHFETLGN